MAVQLLVEEGDRAGVGLVLEETLALELCHNSETAIHKIALSVSINYDLL